MPDMFNLRNRANQILFGLFILSGVVMAFVLLFLALWGRDTGKWFDSAVIQGSIAGFMSFLGILLLLVAIQDCWQGETSYTAKGRLLKSDGVQQTFEILTKTAVRSESPWTFWTVVLVKGFGGLLSIAIPAAGLAILVHRTFLAR